MRYFKLTQVDAKTGVSVNRETSKEGPKFPDISGLNVLLQDNINSCFYYATADKKAKPDPENQCWELTLAEFADAIKACLDRTIGETIDALYREERDMRRVHLVGKYDDTASIAGIYKYEQAKALLDGAPAGPDIAAEASVRGVTPLELAARIVQHHESFRAKETLIAGLRGKQLDRINGFQFNAADPWGSWQEFMKTEVIGTREEQAFENGEAVTKQVDIVARYYGAELGARFDVAEKARAGN